MNTTGGMGMDWVIGNSFFLLLLLVCLGMHFFGHKHGNHDADHDRKNDGPRVATDEKTRGRDV